MIDESNETVVFVGPTLSVADARQILKADYRPPVAFGDIYSLIGSSVTRVLIIDGLFYGTSAVWQREIVEAMTQGIRVYGCSSMGALRAAELQLEGMIGFGQVYKWILDSTITGDDEVAVAHEPTLPYRQLTIPLVNIRYGLLTAVDDSVVTKEEASCLFDIAKSINYHERTAESLFYRVNQTLNNNSLRRLYKLWSNGIPDIKAADALNALRNLSEQDHKESSRQHVSTLYSERGRVRRICQWKALPFIFRLINTYPHLFNPNLQDDADVDSIFKLRADMAEKVAAQMWLLEMAMDWLEDVVKPSPDWKNRYRNSLYDSIALLPDDLLARCNSAGISFVEFQCEVNRRADIHFYLKSIECDPREIDDLAAIAPTLIDPLNWSIWPLMQGTDYFMSTAEIRSKTTVVILRLLSIFGIDKNAFKESFGADANIYQLGPSLPGILGYQEWDKMPEVSKLLLLSDLVGS